MRITFSVLLSGLLFCGCVHKQATPAGSAIDLIQTGTDTTWPGGYVLHVTQRDGSSLRGIRLVQSRPDGVTITHTAEVGAVSPGKLKDSAATNFVTIVIHNAKAEGVTASGQRVTNIEDVTLQLSR
jgi:hypothetical protein